MHAGHISMPRLFILDMAEIHGQTLKHFMVGEAQLTLNDIECLCTKFPRLETLVCSGASPDYVGGTRKYRYHLSLTVPTIRLCFRMQSQVLRICIL